jgi:hypothetical protein
MHQITQCPALYDSCLPRPNQNPSPPLKNVNISPLAHYRQAMLCELPPSLEGDKSLVSTQHWLALQTPVLLKLFVLIYNHSI